MSPLGSGYTRRSRRIAAFILAIILPVLAAAANAHFSVLQYIPFALYFISVAIVATLEGLPPALLAALCSSLSRSYFLAVRHHGHWSFRLPDVVGATVLLLGALLISAITKSRRRTAEQLRERTETLVESLHSGKCASWVIDIDKGERARWYSGSYPVFGRRFDEIEQLPSPLPLLHPADQHRLPGLIDHMKTSSRPLVFEFRTLWPNGEVHWLESRGTRVPGRPSVWRGITVDITERRLTEAALIRSEKLAAMGRLASTVAHEINNPLESVTNLLYLARTDPTLSEDTRSYLATAELELARLGDITRLTLGFVRTNESRHDLEVGDVIESVLSIFRARYEMKSIRIERNYQSGVCVTLPPHELRQITTNLIANAIDALSGANARVAIHILREQDTAVLLLEDNGVGIADDHLTRVFEPFFTTKADIGTGIGLWVTRELVHKNGGRISVQSGDLDCGMKTRFRVEFPITATSPAGANQVSPASSISPASPVSPLSIDAVAPSLP